MKTKKRQNESALVCSAQRGDKEALQTLLTRNWAWMKGLVYSIVGLPDQVDDVLQDICVRVIRKIDTLREPERFRPWLAVLARREALKFRQRRAQRPMQLQEEFAELTDDDKARHLHENMEQKELFRQIIEAIRSLPEKYRQVFMLQHSGDLTYGQIAEILDIPVTTVQIRLVRARRMIYNIVSTKDSKNIWGS
ncbi:MAG: RNA polymerase sigma factor [Sedimentisphaerales bacterium]|nr:RNA polymerase sigma factor [Sedimentisphaerales bacterium]